MHAGRLRALVLALVLLPLAAGCVDDTAEPARPSPLPERFTTSGTACVEIGAFFNADATTVRGYVPPAFTFFASAGERVPLAVAALVCETLAVDGNATTNPTWSDVGVQIEAPDGSDGAHFYQLWQVAGDPMLDEAARALTVRGGLAANLSVALVQTLPVAGQAQADVPWGEEAYALTLAYAGPAEPSFPLANTWWHLGERGLVRTDYTFVMRGAQGGPATLTTGAHSGLGHLVGEEATGAGALFRFDVEGTTALTG